MISTIFLVSLLPATTPEAPGRIPVPQTLHVGNEHLSLNGKGLRKKFMIKLFSGALYLKTPSSNAWSVIHEDEAVAMRLHFIHDLSAEQLSEAFAIGFQQMHPMDVFAEKQDINAFCKLFSQDANEGDIYDIVYLPEKGLEVHHNNVLLGSVTGQDIKRTYFGLWFADHLMDRNLHKMKKAMLGK